jgi:O-acetyl-ADP-ribose deacetylase (regulator of RNase III)
MKIQYVIGDATRPCTSTHLAMIVHCCNDIGAWGAGFVLALDRAFQGKPGTQYRTWATHKSQIPGTTGRFTLGEVQYVTVTTAAGVPALVCNIIGQHGTGPQPRKLRRSPGPPVRYWALAHGLKHVQNHARTLSGVMGVPVSIHCPRMGCGLAGGDWQKVEKILSKLHPPVYVYDLSK